jgi:riboflavin synthase alpha subunit
MFSGLIEHRGFISLSQPTYLELSSPKLKVKKGDSVAVNGVCLTIVTIKPRTIGLTLGFDVSPETSKLTTLRNLPVGAKVNLETALTASSVLGGHIVQGHVDGVGTVSAVIPEKSGKTIWIEAPADIRRTLVLKGSITVDGVSLTIAYLKKSAFAVALIPYTLRGTTLGDLKKGARVNLEADIIGKYVHRYLKNK